VFRALCLPLLVVAASLPVGSALRPAGADSIGNLQTEAATVAQRLVLEQLQVDAARQETSVASAEVSADAEAITQLGQQLAADQRDLAQHLHVVQSQAIQSYIDSGADSSSSDTTLFAGGSARAQAASEYASLAVGNITTQMDQLHTAQHALQAQESALQARQAQDRADQARQSAALDQADAAAGALQAQQAQVTGQLAAAVSAQQAAQAQAAAAAVAKAPKHTAPTTTSATIATQAPTTVTTPSGGSGGTPTPTAPASNGDPYPNLPDPVLNAFLTCVVQAESGGDYSVVSPNGLYMGAFQFSQPTWNTAASAAGLGLLVGVPPNEATRAEQDTVAVTLYTLDGQQPWLGDRCSQ
jgi:hypothetical protein